MHKSIQAACTNFDEYELDPMLHEVFELREHQRAPVVLIHFLGKADEKAAPSVVDQFCEHV